MPVHILLCGGLWEVNPKGVSLEFTLQICKETEGPPSDRMFIISTHMHIWKLILMFLFVGCTDIETFKDWLWSPLMRKYELYSSICDLFERNQSLRILVDRNHNLGGFINLWTPKKCQMMDKSQHSQSAAQSRPQFSDISGVLHDFPGLMQEVLETRLPLRQYNCWTLFMFCLFSRCASSR